MKFYGTIKELIPKLFELDQEKNYLVEIKEPKKKRSLESNRLLWLLIHKIAKETYQDDMEIYITTLERADAKSDYIITRNNIEEELKKNFRAVKFVRTQEVNGNDCYVFKVYIGSSKMNTKEMTELLDIVYQMCSELGIATEEYEI